MKKIIVAILLAAMLITAILPVSAAETALVKDYKTASDGDLLYTVDFRGDAAFEPKGVQKTTTHFVFTPSEDGKALTITGAEGAPDATAGYWGGIVEGLEADTKTVYTMVYKVKANGNVGKNNSVGVGGWIDNKMVTTAKFYNNYGNHTTADENGGIADRRLSLSLKSDKIVKSDGSTYIMMDTLGKYAVDADGFITLMIEFNGPESNFTSFILAEGAGDGTKESDWIKIETQKMTLNKVADAMGFMVYICYTVVNTTIKDVEIYKGTKIDYPEPETEPETTKPAGNTPAESAPEAEQGGENAPETEPAAASGGCGGTVSFAGLALVSALGACATFVSKKRRVK